MGLIPISPFTTLWIVLGLYQAVLYYVVYTLLFCCMQYFTYHCIPVDPVQFSQETINCTHALTAQMFMFIYSNCHDPACHLQQQLKLLVSLTENYSHLIMTNLKRSTTFWTLFGFPGLEFWEVEFHKRIKMGQLLLGFRYYQEAYTKFNFQN